MAQPKIVMSDTLGIEERIKLVAIVASAFTAACHRRDSNSMAHDVVAAQKLVDLAEAAVTGSHDCFDALAMLDSEPGKEAA